MELDHEFTVTADADTAWPVLLDVERMHPLVPGVVYESGEDGEYRGRLKLRFGPTTITYRGTVRIAVVDDLTRTAILEVSAREARGPGTVTGSFQATVLPVDGSRSRVALHTRIEFTGGRAAALSEHLVHDTGAKLLSRFSANLDALLTSPAAPPGQPAPAEPIKEAATVPPEPVEAPTPEPAAQAAPAEPAEEAAAAPTEPTETAPEPAAETTPAEPGEETSPAASPTGEPGGSEPALEAASVESAGESAAVPRSAEAHVPEPAVETVPVAKTSAAEPAVETASAEPGEEAAGVPAEVAEEAPVRSAAEGREAVPAEAVRAAGAVGRDDSLELYGLDERGGWFRRLLPVVGVLALVLVVRRLVRRR